MQQETTFTIIIEAQEMLVRYRPDYFVSARYAHFEFKSTHTPPRRIMVSDTGYLSHFSPMHEIEAAPGVEEYARVLALGLMGIKSNPDCGEEEQGSQLPLF